MSSALIIAMIVVSSIALIVMIIFASVKSYNTSVQKSQSICSDKKLLEIIASQPDQIINKQNLSRLSGLSKGQTRSRLYTFQLKGLVQVMYADGYRPFYKLKNPLRKPVHGLSLSEDPFMTVEDLLSIFKAFNYKVTLQELIFATGLPIKVIEKEMKYFKKENVITTLMSSDGFSYSKKQFILNEPYRSNPEAFEKIPEANFELREMYHKMRNDDFV